MTQTREVIHVRGEGDDLTLCGQSDDVARVTLRAFADEHVTCERCRLALRMATP